MVHVQATVSERVLRLRLTRAEKKNALTGEMYATLTQALSAAETDDGIHVVLFEADGDSFTAGNDLRDFAAVASGERDPRDLEVLGFLAALCNATKPYVAAVQGAAIGIGTTLLLHCDLVYVAEDARLATPFANLALVPEAGSSALLPARIGYVRAYEMFALGKTIDGRTAAQLGLANAAVPAAELAAHAFDAARALAHQPLDALRETKRLMRDAEGIRAVMQREIDAFGKCLRSPEALAALRAFAARKQ
jgi:enoyl-CoA hydratase/carnithine racemase